MITVGEVRAALPDPVDLACASTGPTVITVGELVFKIVSYNMTA